MPRVHRFFDGGFIDILSLVAVVFLVVTAITGAIVVSNRNTNLNIRNKASTICMDPCLQDSDCAASEYCYRPATGCAVCKAKTTTPVPTPAQSVQTAQPVQTPAQTAPSCGSASEPCCGQGYPNGKCNSGLYCSNIDSGTCVTNVCHAERKCDGSVLQICKDDNSGWNNTTCPYGCSPTTKDCNSKPTPIPTPTPTATSLACSGIGHSCLDPYFCCNGLDCNTQNICVAPTPTPTITPSPTITPTLAPAATGCPQYGESWCSNAGTGNTVLTVDHDVTRWSECLAWCELNMSTSNPLCQFNSGGPRNCWVKRPPPGGVSACIWAPGAPPYGACYSGNSAVSIAAQPKTCMDSCISDTDCGSGNYCYKPATGCPICKPANSLCIPGAKQCSGNFLQVCNSQGIGWLSEDCGSAGCNPNTLTCNYKSYGSSTCANECSITESCILIGNGYYGCLKNSSLLCVPGRKQCSGNNLQTCDAKGASFINKDCGTSGCDSATLDCTSAVIPITSHFECSLSGDYALHIDDLSLGIDWSKSLRCNLGCKNGACVGGISTSCQEGQTSLDHFETCVGGKWWCVPGQTRRLTAPGQSNIPNIISGCDQDHKPYVLSDSTASLQTLYCDGDNLVDNTKKIITTCPTGESCLTNKDYSFIAYAGCYQKTYIDANKCKAGDIKEPKLPGDCKQVCNNGNWKYTDPPDCLRDPNVYLWRTCSHDIRSNVLKNGKVVENCSWGCSYGQCIPPEPKSECNSDEGYLTGSPNQCLVSCVNGHYQNTQICTNTLDLKGPWNTDELLMMFKAISEFPEAYSGMIDKIPFIRLAQPVADCFNDCTSLSGGVYGNNGISSSLKIPGSITIPDSGTDRSTLDHEVMHAVSDMNPEDISGFIKATGCRQNPADPNGLYLFSEAPYREYGQTNCEEGIAVSCGEEYMDPQLSCTMQTARPNAYKFCKDKVFGGKEYCNSKPQSSILNKFKAVASSLFTSVYAADTQTVVSNSIENKLATIVPGTTNIKDLELTLGQPTQTIQQDGKTIFTYASTDESRSHLVYVENGVVTFVQIVLIKNQNLTLTNIINQYGVPEEKSFSTHSPNSPVYSYPSKGISFFLDGNTNQVFMIQKYIPITLTQFNETIGKNFSNQQYGDTFQEVALIKEQLTAKPGNQQVGSTNNLYIILIISIASVIFLISATVLIIRYRIKKRNQNIINPPPIIQT